MRRVNTMRSHANKPDREISNSTKSINLGYLTAEEFDAWVKPEEMC